MAYNSNFDRKQRRDAERRQQKVRHRQILLRYVAIGMVAAVALLVGGVLLSRALSGNLQTPQLSTTPSTSVSTPSQPTQPPEPQTPTDQIQLVFGGDLVVNDTVVQSGMFENRYDYTSIFQDVAPVLSNANGACINFEGTTAGKPYGTASHSAPPELLNALARAGVDLVQLSNSCTVSNGILGISATIKDIQKAGMLSVGAYSDQDQAKKDQGFTMCNFGGIRVALIGYTKGFDGLSLPQNSQWCVNLLYTDYASAYQKVAEDAILATMQAVQAQKPDLTVALLHWGSEYNDIISKSQKKIEELLLANGVDAIIGTHSHYVQQVKYDPEAGTVVAYSLGDLFSGGKENGSHYSILLQLEVTRDNRTGDTRITGCDYVPIYTLTPERDEEPLRVVRLENAMQQYDSNHIHKVTDKAYENMKSALARIRSRVGF